VLKLSHRLFVGPVADYGHVTHARVVLLTYTWLGDRSLAVGPRCGTCHQHHCIRLITLQVLSIFWRHICAAEPAVLSCQLLFASMTSASPIEQGWSLGLDVSASRRPRDFILIISVSSQSRENLARSRLGLVSNKISNISVSSRSRALRPRLQANAKLN